MYCHQCGAEVSARARFCPFCGTCLAPAQAPSAVPVPPVGMRGQRTGTTGQGTRTDGVGGAHQLLWALLALAAVFALQVAGVLVAMLLGLDLELSTLAFGAAGAIAMLFVLGGSRLVSFSRNKVAWVMRQGLWSVVVSVGLLVYELVALLMEGSFEVADGWAGRIAYLAVTCALIGIFEEATFRGILLGGLIGCWGSTRRGVIACVTVSSVLFGCAHVEWWSLDMADPLQLSQAVLKICQTGTYAFFLGTMVVRTRGLWGVCGLHALNDFLLLVLSVGLLGEGMDVSYVSEGADGIATIVLYVVVILLYLPLVRRAWVELRAVESADPLLGHRRHVSA